MAKKRKPRKTPQIIKANLRPDTVYIFTDGSCYPNPGPGGWAAVLLFNGVRKEIYGGSRKTTNNEMELTGILMGLRALKSRKYPVIVHSDSEYCVKAVSEWHIGWRRRDWHTSDGKPVKNVKLIQEILALAPGVVFKWVKGHIGHEHNERADVLAGEGRRQYGR